MKFSQRYGYTPVKNAIQLESMDGDLRNALWSVLTLHYWDTVYWNDEIRNRRRLFSNIGNEPIAGVVPASLAALLQEAFGHSSA